MTPINRIGGEFCGPEATEFELTQDLSCSARKYTVNDAFDSGHKNDRESPADIALCLSYRHRHWDDHVRSITHETLSDTSGGPTVPFADDVHCLLPYLTVGSKQLGQLVARKPPLQY